MAKGDAGVALRGLEHLFRRGTVVGLSDRQLLERFAARHDPMAFAALVDRHGPMVLGVCRRILSDTHAADDAFQAAFLVLVRKAGSVRVDDSLGRWLYTVARRIALRAGAEATRWVPVSPADDAPVFDPDLAEREELRAAVDEELGRLPASYRDPIVLCHLEGLTHEEAARRLRWPVGTVKGRLARARGLLRTRLARRGLGASAGLLAATLRPASLSASLIETTVSAAIGFAATGATAVGSVPAAVVLANGVIRTMSIAKVKLVTTALMAFGVGTWVARVGLVRTPGPSPLMARADEPKGSSAIVSGSRVAEKSPDVRPAVPPRPIDDSVEAVEFVRAYMDGKANDLEKGVRETDRAIEQAKLEIGRLAPELERQKELLSYFGEKKHVLAKELTSLRSAQERDRRNVQAATPVAPARPAANAGVLRRAESAAPRPATEGTKRSMPDYVVEPPDMLIISVFEALPGRSIEGERLVRPDGKVSLGYYGDVYVAGLTPQQIKEKVVLHLRQYLTDLDLGLVKNDGERLLDVDPKDSTRVSVDISAYNSKVYYVQGEVATPGRIPITGSETVLDAINFAGGLTASADATNIRLIRPAPPGAGLELVLPVDLAAIVNRANATTNYQLMPGDRLVVYRATSDVEPEKIVTQSASLIAAKLETAVMFHADNQPLSVVIDNLKKMTGLRIELGSEGELGYRTLPGKLPVTGRNERPMPLKQLLVHLLKPLGLTYRIEADKIVIVGVFGAKTPGPEAKPTPPSPNPARTRQIEGRIDELIRELQALKSELGK